jgi:hypothetical protein
VLNYKHRRRDFDQENILDVIEDAGATKVQVDE